MFLSHLSVISGGCKKIMLLSLGSFWSNLNFYKMMRLTAWLCEWKVRVNGIRSFSSFSDVCSADCQSICCARCWPVLATESGYSRFLKNWHISSDFLEKSESSLHTRRSLRN